MFKLMKKAVQYIWQKRCTSSRQCRFRRL